MIYYLVVIMCLLVILKYTDKIILHIFYGILLKKENKRRDSLGLPPLKYDLPFEKEDE